MKISVIVPVYNAENYLSACLDSILSQTYQNFEIILINDGSKDASGQICDAYARKDERIRVVHQENHGVSHARNRGLELATGELISFIDSDDTLEPDMYELLVRVMQEHDADISHCGYKHIVGEEIRLIHDTKRVIPQSTQDALDCFVTGRLFGGGLWNKLYRRNLLTGLSFREDLKNNEDILFNFEAFRRADHSVFADYPLYNYVARFGSSAVFTIPSEKKIQDSCIVSQIIWETLQGTPLQDSAAVRHLRSLRSYYLHCAKYAPDKCSNIRSDILLVAGDSSHLGRSMSINVALIRHCPWLFRLVYTTYDKLRKPQWEARKD